MQKSKQCRKHLVPALSKAGSNSTTKKSTKMINTNLFSETMKVDNGNLSSEDDNYFSDTEDK